MAGPRQEPRSRAGRAARAVLGSLHQPVLRGARELRRLLLGPELAVRTAMVPRRVRHLSGPASFGVREDELVVVCLVRDGEPWLRAFLDHYRSLGVERFVFVDNGSMDATQKILEEAGDDISVFETRLVFRYWEFAIKRWMVHRFAGDGWVLLADVDELMDYPRESEVPVQGILRYLNEHGFTAVALHLVDLYSAQSPWDTGHDDDIRQLFRLFELESVRHRPFARSGTPRWLRRLRLEGSDPGTWAGGVMQRVFGFDAPLTKMTLLRPAGGAKLYDAHWVTDAVLADVAAVLLHYRFVDGYLDRLQRAVRLKNYWGGSTYHRWILDAIERDPDLRLTGPTSREYRGADDLVSEGFLAASEAYMNWASEDG